MHQIKALGRVLREAAADFAQDECLTRAGALAFYGALAVAPMLLVVLAASTWIDPSVEVRILDRASQLVGPEAAEALRMVTEGAEEDRRFGLLSAILGVATLLFSASAIFAQLQQSLNRIWEVAPRPGGAVRTWVRQRLLSIVMVLGMIVLVLLTLGVSAVLAYLLPGVLWRVMDVVATIAVFTLAFAATYRLLPDVETAWRDVWVGAAITAILFAAGKVGIGVYLANAGVGSSYGAAGSLVLLLVWMYYAAVIFLFGAEVTQVVAHRFRERIRPAPWAVPVEEPGTAAAVPAAAEPVAAPPAPPPEGPPPGEGRLPRRPPRPATGESA